MTQKAYLGGMRYLAILLALTLTATAAPAQEAPEEEGFLEQGVRRLFEGLMQDIAPELDQLQSDLDRAAEELGPVLRDLVGLIDDLRNYEAPRRLPNGDILIPRKPDAPLPPDLRDEGAEIEI